MKKGELKAIIKEQIKIIREEDDSEFQRPKGISSAVGPKQERGVIEGDAVKGHKDAILRIIKKHDPNNKMIFYPATGKIVGAVITNKLPHIRKDLVSIDKGITIEIKNQKFR